MKLINILNKLALFVLLTINLNTTAAQSPCCINTGFSGNKNISIGSITPQIHLSSTGGDAPFYLYASSYQTTAVNSANPYYDLEYTWDFGEPSSTTLFNQPVCNTTVSANNNQKGPEAAYLYQNPGTFTVTLNIKGWSGSNYVYDTLTTTVVVNAYQGQYKYFDPSQGDDNNTGDDANNAWKTWSKMASWLGGGNQRGAYIARGDTMMVTSTLTSKKSDSRIEAYGVGNKPVLIASPSLGNSNFFFINGTNATIANLYFSNIIFDVNSTAGSVFFGYAASNGEISNMVFDHCIFKNGSSESLVLTTGSGQLERILLWNCHFYANQGARQNFVPYNTPYCAVMGGYQDGGNGNPLQDHHMYINQCNHSLIRWVEFGPTVNRNFCLNMNSPSNGNNTNYTLIDGCEITGTNNGIDFSNANNNTNGQFSNAIVQYCAIHDLNTDNQGLGILGYSINDLSIRNNQFYNNKLADLDIKDPNTELLVVNNIFYTSNLFPHNGINIISGQKGTIMDNSFLTDASSNSFHLSGDFSVIANWEIDNNQYWNPNILNAFYETSTNNVHNFTTWQGLGYDLTSIEVNPQYPDPIAGDFGYFITTNTFNGMTNFWNEPLNWSLGEVPTACHDVIISANHISIINSMDKAECHSITLESNALLNCKIGFELKVIEP